MEKNAQNPSGAPRRRRRRRGSGTGASQSAQAQNPAAREAPKAGQPASGKEKPARSPSPRKEGRESVSAGRSRHRGQQAESPAQQPAPGRRSRAAGQAAPARDPNHGGKTSPRAARSARRLAEEEPGLELITRRPPKQKFANFEEYLTAHGGMTAPLPGEEPASAEGPAPQPAPAAPAQ